MKTDVLSTILTFSGLLLVEGLYLSEFSQTRNWANRSRRIINGQAANPADFSFLVQLRIDPDSLCGGSIIHSYFILTAAHCMFGVLCASLKVYPSTYTGGNESPIELSDCYTHGAFNPKEFHHDIGITRTIENMITYWKLSLIDLPSPGTMYYEGMAATIVGWGETGEPVFPNSIYRATVIVGSWYLCNVEYQQAHSCLGGGECPIPHSLPIENICTVGTAVEPPGPCEGDFGGPVIINHELAAVMSGGIMDNFRCVGGTPSVHVLLVHYLPWIKEIIYRY